MSFVLFFKGMGPGYDCPMSSGKTCSATGASHGGSGGRSENQQWSSKAYGSFKRPRHFGTCIHCFLDNDNDNFNYYRTVTQSAVLVNKGPSIYRKPI